MLVKSSDPIELAGLCDRVVVMSRGRIVDEIHRRPSSSERRIIAAIIGQASRHTEPVMSAAESNGRRRCSLGRWLPIAAMVMLIVILGAYTNHRKLVVPVQRSTSTA